MAHVEVVRTDFVDSSHAVAACCVDASGEPISELAVGDSARVVLMRSAAKPFQASVAVAAGVLEDLGLTDEHLAVACGSHNASERHLELVHEILSRAGVGHGELRCGDDGAGGPFRHQCSGNHALALAVCAANGWDRGAYLEADHPLQLEYTRVVTAACAVANEPQPVRAQDGCGMTAYGVTLRAMAAAFGRLGAGWGEIDGLARCRDAMQTYPDIVRWPGEIDTELMRSDDRVVAKIGAEAVIGIGLASGVGCAARVLDGSIRALGPLGVRGAEMIGAVVNGTALTKLRNPPLLNNNGETVGHLQLVD